MNKKLNLAHVDTIKEMHDALTARLGIVVSILNYIVKKLKDPKSVKQNGEGALVKGRAWSICRSRTGFVVTWFKQATAKHAVISGTLLKERLHIAIMLDSEDSAILMPGSATEL